MDPSPSKPNLLERLSSLLMREPEDREQLLSLLHGAFERNLLDADALSIIEGALAVSDMQVRDIMVPRAQMDVVDINDDPEKIAAFVIEATHSRFPAIDEHKDDVIGILLAKDLLNCFVGRDFDLRGTLRPAIFIPESKRLNVLLREFRASHNHMAVVVDEYGGVSGLVTIEDVLEQIVGDIEDEYDFDETAGNIVLDNTGRYRVKATTEIEDFNTAFGTELANDDFDTVGGFVIHELGRLPKRGEVIFHKDLRISILRADSRRVHTLLIDRQRTLPLADKDLADA
ncbi:MAG TPA: transporter associated domain-containing protein [Roseateles sp.]|jgi:magnesium and cobalt transporter|nr:transporter associated domain-containing protein [Roseateles sp.]HEX2604354.1 transporter associated domain-containing protein [Oxalicibacterium sp.]HWT53842.1 transporter associated domain-containing protein [Rhodocyclaceae bacterium]